MTTFPFFATLISYLVLLLPLVAYGYNKLDITSWCDQTPHPESCNYFLANNQYSGQVKQKSDFIKALLKVTLERAQHAESNTRGLGLKCRNKREKAAWEDCIELYENTVERLNMTVDPHKPCNQYEMQTWLSTALTNVETCVAGFRELGVGGYLLPPLMSNNVSSLIKNTLAMNKGGSPPSSYKKGGFPTWVKPGDRKLLQSSKPEASQQANVVVAQDGSGNYKTIGEAIAAKSGSGRYVIYVKAGTYKENIQIGAKSKNIMLLGDGIGKTIITGSKSVGGGATTFNSATVGILGDGFIGRGITFRNTAGPQNHQAVALRSGSDLSVFYQCSFEGYQDTLYVHSDRQFYRECNIYGTVDFIFGNAAVVFQNCNIYARNPPNKMNTVTAQGRSDPNQNTGISIINCRVMAASDLKGATGSVKTYLGRPWHQYSRTVFMKTFLDGLVDPTGWMPWSGNFALNTLYYGEYMNTGPGSSTAKRVSWKGYRVITSATEAAKFTVGNFIAGGAWLPATKVPFTPGL
ncbi:putative pectinesterase [Helianthus annuus]|nr:putative pectinesterase [Helianthus annuus]KAJ0775797.1 putative pectinesterase [Helianthus annuus]KAJ0938100.1 putative pectinesterase [Helianthus annuus]